MNAFMLLLISSLIGCNGVNQEAQNPQQGYGYQERNVTESDTAHLQPFNNTHTANRKQGRTGSLHNRDRQSDQGELFGQNRNDQGWENEQGQLRGQNRNNQDRWNEQGKSSNEHGHIDRRPTQEKKAKKPAANPRYKQIQLLGINDLHGLLNVTRRVNNRPVGRVDYLAAYLKQRAADNKNTLFVHAGDMIGASPPISALLRDEPTIEFLNKMNFDIGAVGNHEFDRGVDELLRIDAGGAHEDIDMGEVTWGNVYTVQPFNNMLVKMTLTGQQIRDALNQQWQPNTTRMLQISGLSYTWDALQPPGQKVLSISLPDGSELDPDQAYTVVVNSFLAGGGDSFTVFRDGTNRETGPVDLDALVDYIKTLPQPFNASIEDRIQKVQY